jgi:hypothetical protein
MSEDRTFPVEDRTFPVERVSVAIDPTALDLGTIATVAEIAARLRSMIDVICVEDVNLFRLAALPVARQVSLAPAGAEATFDTAQLEAALRATARQAEAALADAARRLGLAWSLRSVRGEMPAALEAALGAHDLLVVSAGEPARMRLGETSLRGAARDTERSVLLLLAGRAVPRDPIVVLEPGSTLIERAIAASVRIAGNGRRLTLLLPGEDADAARLVDQARRQLAAHGVAPQVARIGTVTTASICAATATAGSDIVVVTGDLSCLAAEGAETLMVQTRRPVMVVR